MLEEQDQNQAKREARSFPKLWAEVTELGGLIVELWPHVRAASHIVGIPEPPTISPSPRDTKGPSLPMVRLFDDINDFKRWIQEINEGLSAPLKELVPMFYENMVDEKKEEPQV